MDELEKKARRYNDEKLRLGLIPPHVIEQVAKVFDYGAKKYTKYDDEGNIVDDGARNWENGCDWEVPLESLKRHLLAFESGEDYDIGTKEKPGSGLLHMSHIATNAMFLIQYYKTHPHLDNRRHAYLNQPKVGLDFDGVLADFSSAYKQRLIEAGVENYPQDEQPHWSFPYGTNEVWDKIKSDESFWLNLKPLCDPEDLAFPVEVYISKRSIPVEWSQKWVVRNGFPAAPIIHVEHSKVDAVRGANIDIFVDDSVKNFVELNRAKLHCLLMDAPYNRYLNVGHKRIKHLREVLN